VQELLACGLVNREVVDLIDLYLSDSSVMMADLARASGQMSSLKSLAEIAHRLAGSSANLGLSAFEQTARDLEASCRGGLLPPGGGALPETLVAEYERSRESLLRLREQLAPRAAAAACMG
jgi:HPt (histidine-containing phosphotransfer) domain-containing protein